MKCALHEGVQDFKWGRVCYGLLLWVWDNNGQVHKEFYVGWCAAYEVRNIPCLQACVSGVGGGRRSVRRRSGVEACLPGWAREECKELVASLGLDYEKWSWPTLHKLIESWSRFPD